MELEALLYEYGNQNFNFVPPKANFLHVVVEAALSLQQRNLLHHQRHGIERDGKNRIHLKIKGGAYLQVLILLISTKLEVIWLHVKNIMLCFHKILLSSCCTEELMKSTRLYQGESLRTQLT